MSAFSQHDEMDPLPSDDDLPEGTVTIGQCPFCDNATLGFDDGRFIQATRQLVQHDGTRISLCDHHWRSVARGTDEQHITRHNGIYVIYVPAPIAA